MTSIKPIIMARFGVTRPDRVSVLEGLFPQLLHRLTAGVGVSQPNALADPLQEPIGGPVPRSARSWLA